ncbi:MAG: DUF4340 domain-containing protein [Nitrospinae bacterium]|nr:DUF4340 domain-containing protein [Nitrospinota bacterium]
MRYFKTTFIWIIALAAVVGISYIDFEKTRVEEEKKDRATRLFPFDSKEVLAIVIEKDGAQPLELERWEEGWRVVAPIKSKGASQNVDKFLGYVTDSRNDAEYVMDANPTQERLTEFGLLKPSLRVTLKTGKDLKPYTLIFGDRAPTMGVAFAMLEGRKEVYRVLAAARGEADKDLYYFRDKTVLALKPEMIDQFAVERGGLAFRAKLPDNGKWVIEKPIKAIADHAKAFEYIGAFVNAEVKEFVSDKKENLASYGLEKPAIQALFWQAGDGEPTVRLSIGDRSPEKRGYFCSMSDRDNIFILDEEVINAIPKSANDIRSRELMFFEINNLKRIELRVDNKSLTLLRDKDKEWRKNSVTGEKMDFNAVKETLDELLAFSIKDFVPSAKDMREFGLENPLAQIMLWEEASAVPIHLSVGKTTPTGNSVYARTGSEPDVLVLDERVVRVLRTIFN